MKTTRMPIAEVQRESHLREVLLRHNTLSNFILCFIIYKKKKKKGSKALNKDNWPNNLFQWLFSNKEMKDVLNNRVDCG